MGAGDLCPVEASQVLADGDSRPCPVLGQCGPGGTLRRWLADREGPSGTLASAARGEGAWSWGAGRPGQGHHGGASPKVLPWFCVCPPSQDRLTSLPQV